MESDVSYVVGCRRVSPDGGDHFVKRGGVSDPGGHQESGGVGGVILAGLSVNAKKGDAPQDKH